MTRELVVGLEAVLADGTVLDGLKPLIKNNTGIDLKQVFIGTEGIMGIVTRAVLRLVSKPGSRTVALCALPSFDAVRSLLRQARQRLGGELTAFEVMWDSYFSRALTLAGKTPPLAAGRPYYALVEASSVDAGGGEHLERLLQVAIENGAVVDAVIAKSGAENEALWKLRDLSVEVNSLIAPLVTFDVSLPIADMERFVPQFQQAARDIDARCETIVYGHLGDGNLHLTVHQPADRPETVRLIQEAVYALVGRHGGSISAEHGIGIAKREFLPHSRSAAEIATMHALKDALDPMHLLNRGRVLEHRERAAA
jgi:FAD/FMN-containing dehydrogenase